MRPSPGVTCLQYFLMSLAQVLSSFSTLAFSLSRIVLPTDVCAETEPADKTASNGNTPSLASNFMVIFIESPFDGFEGNGLVVCAATRGLGAHPHVLIALKQA